MVLIQNKDMCCGCRVCEKVCPKNAITMVEDECGFLYPQIDQDKCIDCGLCAKKCAFQNGYETRKEFEPSLGFGARHKEESGYMNSRSGGAFVALSNYVLAQGGSVYGAGFDEEEGFYKVVHKAATDKKSRNEFRGSKYVQSDLKNTFPEIKEKLEKGEYVLFSGVGCQVGALYAYLPKEYDTLFTIDILCHGVPSPRLWKEFLQMREKEFHGKVEAVQFRNKKKYGWKAHRETVQINGKKHNSRIFTKLFYGGFSRPSCAKCIYTNKNRVGDITIADFWGYEKVITDKWDDDKGISLVLINTEQGKKIWDLSEHELDTVECTGHKYRHQVLRKPFPNAENYDEFWSDYQKHGFKYIANKYAGYTPESNWIQDTKDEIKNVLRKCKKALKL